jgi:hypothetical protein
MTDESRAGRTFFALWGHQTVYEKRLSLNTGVSSPPITASPDKCAWSAGTSLATISLYVALAVLVPPCPAVYGSNTCAPHRVILAPSRLLALAASQATLAERLTPDSPDCPLASNTPYVFFVLSSTPETGVAP